MAPNLLLLTIDSLRADHATPELMPTLAAHAADGVRCSRAYANGYSTPISFPTILTSTYANHYGGHGFMAAERPFLAERLRDAGYRTAAFHTNPHLRVEKNYDAGFDFYNDFDDEAGGLSRIRYLITQNLDSDSAAYKLLKRVYHRFRTRTGSTDYAPAQTINERALDWLDEEWEGDAPFFLWNHYMDVHYPFYPPGEFLERDVPNARAVSVNGKMHERGQSLTEADVADLRALYRGDVRYMDHHLGELLDALADRGLSEDTVVAVTSDHGELFDEHGLFGHPPSGYEESLRVPLVLFGPGVPSGEAVDGPVSLADLPPTLVDLLEVDDDPEWEGRSIRPAVGRGRTSGDRTFVAGDAGVVLAAQTDDWRLVHWDGRECPADPDREWELLTLPAGEPVPPEEHEDVVAGLREELDAYVSRAGTEQTLEEPDVDDATQQRLEALGYK